MRHPTCHVEVPHTLKVTQKSKIFILKIFQVFCPTSKNISTSLEPSYLTCGNYHQTILHQIHLFMNFRYT